MRQNGVCPRPRHQNHAVARCASHELILDEQQLSVYKSNHFLSPFPQVPFSLEFSHLHAMIFKSLLASLLLASAAFAAPSSGLVATPGGGKPLVNHQGKPLQRLKNTDLSAATNVSNIVYSSNWAGAVWDTYPSGSFYKVTGTFTVPTPTAPNGCASIWVGIDGATCQTAILQTGIDFCYNNGAITYDTWWEWFPYVAYEYGAPIAIAPGNVIRVTVTATSTTTGITLLENLSTGQYEEESISAPSYPLCEANAEWIVEDFSSGGSLVPLCNFGTVTFTNAYAYLNNGGVLSPLGADIYEIYQGGVLTSVSEFSGGVTIQYI